MNALSNDLGWTLFSLICVFNVWIAGRLHQAMQT